MSKECAFKVNGRCLFKMAEPYLPELDSLFITKKSFLKSSIAPELLQQLEPALKQIYFESSSGSDDVSESLPCKACDLSEENDKSEST